MNRLLRLLLLPFAIALALALAAPAEAQFETPNRQFHNQTGFPLEGRHRDVACTSCHINSVFKGTPTTCYDCHWERKQDDRFRLQLGSQCGTCHRPVSWTGARFDHAANTGMPLNGAHRQLACQSCHQNNNFQTADTTCFSCHQKDYQSAQTPNHLAAGFPTTCEACHRPSDTSFNLARFDHQASFQLVGVHAQTACATCHRGSVFKGTARDCVGCHQDVVQPHDFSRACPRRVPDDVRELPPADGHELAGRRLQSRRHLPAGRSACAGSVRDVPSQQCLPRHGTRLCRMPPGSVQPHHGPGTCVGGVSDDV